MVWHINKIIWIFVVLLYPTFITCRTYCAETGKAEVYSIVELTFKGPEQNEKDVPARDIDLWLRIRHEGGSPEYKIHGFWDGDGNGGTSGNVFKIRFCPTKTNNAYCRKYKDENHLNAYTSGGPDFWNRQSKGRDDSKS